MTNEERAGLPILWFEDADALDAWFAAEPRSSKGFWLRMAKKGSGVPSISKPDAIDAALCHGWTASRTDTTTTTG